MSRRDDREFDAEVAEHLRLLVDHYRRQGMAPEDAQAAARRQTLPVPQPLKGRIELRPERRKDHDR